MPWPQTLQVKGWGMGPRSRLIAKEHQGRAKGDSVEPKSLARDVTACWNGPDEQENDQRN
jgi:hypothetical protein